MTNERTGGQKGVKPERHDLIPAPALRQLALVYGKGAEKYDDHNWRRGYPWGWSYGALQRHLTAFWSGEDTDPESGLPHLAHAMWHCATLLTFMEEHPEEDDRFKLAETSIPKGAQFDPEQPPVIAEPVAEGVEASNPFAHEGPIPLANDPLPYAPPLVGAPVDQPIPRDQDDDYPSVEDTVEWLRDHGVPSARDSGRTFGGHPIIEADEVPPDELRLINQDDLKFDPAGDRVFGKLDTLGIDVGNRKGGW